jgi:hypothetical protein
VRPLTVITGILFGSCLAIAISLTAVLFVFQRFGLLRYDRNFRRKFLLFVDRASGEILAHRPYVDWACGNRVVLPSLIE